MAATVTPSKITDYFPPSPKVEEQEEQSKRSHPEIDEETPVVNGKGDNEQTLSLQSCSIVFTPKSSPAKEEETSTATEDKDKKEPVAETTCKKSLNDVLKKSDVEIKPAAQSKRKGRKKKNKTTKTAGFLTDVSINNTPGRPKSAKKKTSNAEPSGRNTLLTDYFPVRRSERKSKTLIDKEKEEDLQYKILNHVEDGLEVVDLGEKGRGVVATKDFRRGDFVVEYAGDLIDLNQAKKRDEKYAKDPTKGCYMYYFNFKGKSYCIDATEESGKLGRLLNHSKTAGNCHTKLIGVNNEPYLILAASRDIKSGEELLYDYGDRSKGALEAHPWLKS